jgi:hypothetical protein
MQMPSDATLDNTGPTLTSPRQPSFAHLSFVDCDLAGYPGVLPYVESLSHGNRINQGEPGKDRVSIQFGFFPTDIRCRRAKVPLSGSIA